MTPPHSIDCTNLENLLASLHMETPQEIRDAQSLLTEQFHHEVDESVATEHVFHTVLLQSYARTGRVPFFCQHHCLHYKCRYNGLNYGEFC